MAALRLDHGSGEGSKVLQPELAEALCLQGALMESEKLVGGGDGEEGGKVPAELQTELQTGGEEGGGETGCGPAPIPTRAVGE